MRRTKAAVITEATRVTLLMDQPHEISLTEKLRLRQRIQTVEYTNKSRTLGTNAAEKFTPKAIFARMDRSVLSPYYFNLFFTHKEISVFHCKIT